MENAPEGHAVWRLGRCDLDAELHGPNDGCKNWKPNEYPVRFQCECGAKWAVSKKEHDEGVDHIEDHWRYAKRVPTRVD
jgi:hypothetical protein